MFFRKVLPSDFTQIMQVYTAAVIHMDDMEIHQWDGIYPSAAIINEDIANGELHMGLTDTGLACVFALNTRHDEEYGLGKWLYDGLRYSIIHRLCVCPELQNKGIGTQTMAYIEDELRNDGFEAVRLDAFSLNPAALRLYQKLGYRKAGEVVFRKGLFYLYEKRL